MRLFPAVATAFLCLLLICAGPASSAEPALSFALASDSMSWSIVSGAGVRQQTLLKDARVRLWLTDGSEVVWKEASQDTDGRSMTFVSDQLTLKIVIVYAPNGRPPNTVTLLPLVFSKGSGVSLRDLRMADGAQVLGFGPDSRVFVEGDQGRSPAEIRPLPAQGRVRSWWHTILTRTGTDVSCRIHLKRRRQNTFDMVQMAEHGQHHNVSFGLCGFPLRMIPLDLSTCRGLGSGNHAAQYAAAPRLTEVRIPPRVCAWATPPGGVSARFLTSFLCRYPFRCACRIQRLFKGPYTRHPIGDRVSDELRGLGHQREVPARPQVAGPGHHPQRRIQGGAVAGALRRLSAKPRCQGAPGIPVERCRW